MKLLLPIAPLAFLMVVSCAKKKPQVATLPPVVQKKQTVSSKPKTKAKAKSKSTRSTRSTASSSSSSSRKSKTDSTATTISKPKAVDPLTPDPVKVSPITEIPTFEVPENIQPKVTDGINQGVFIELKW